MTDQPEQPTANASNNTSPPNNHQSQPAGERGPAQQTDDNGWHAEEREHKREERTYWRIQKVVSAITLIFSLIAAGGAAAGAYIAFQAFREAKRQADAAESQITVAKDTEQRQLRAYLHVSHGKWQQYPPQTPNSGPQYGTEIVLNHAGMTPAYKIQVVIVVQIAPYLLNQTKLDNPLQMSGGGVIRREYAILFGEKPISVTAATPFEVNALRLTANPPDPLLGDHRFYVYGTIRYLDIFGLDSTKLERKYDFCFIFHPDREPNGTENGCEKYNKPG